MFQQELIDISTLAGKYVENYKIEKYLSSGSFGSVYLATKNDKKYAIKLFNEAYVLSEYQLHGENNRIKREINIIKSISHENLISYEDDFTFSYQDNTYYCLVMEYFEGVTLRKFIEKNKTIPEDQANFIFNQILDGIGALHDFNIENCEEFDSYGIIHRDLKPENIMIDENGNIKILDFGISKVINYTSITSTGDVMGTYSYMSPEQIKDSKNISKRSDLYSLGVVFYELLTGQLPYKNSSNVLDLINYISNEPPIEPRRKKLDISNHIENIILKLLKKLPYERFHNVGSIKTSLNQKEIILSAKEYDLTPKFILSLFQEKTMLENFQKDGYPKPSILFPAHLQSSRPGVLKFIQDNNYTKIIDPSTLRLAYETFRDTKGLVNLPYAPSELDIVSPEYLNTYDKQKEYVKLVLNEQIKLKSNILLSPFHYSHNSSAIPTVGRNLIAEWLDLDIKLLKESIDYKKNNPSLCDMDLYAGICLHAESLSSAEHQEYILNTFSALDCDGYIIYADCINNDTSSRVLYNYIKTLQELQKNTKKPVIAARVNSIGLGLLCAGITGYISGAAQFDSFYEGLYKDTSDSYNLYERYYFPQLLNLIGIKKKEPSRLLDINNILGTCACPYCKDKSIDDIIKSDSNKLHFMHSINFEIEQIKQIESTQRIAYFIKRIENAIDNYKKLQTLFAPKDYLYLKRWKVVFEKLNDEK